MSELADILTVWLHSFITLFPKLLPRVNWVDPAIASGVDSDVPDASSSHWQMMYLAFDVDFQGPKEGDHMELFYTTTASAYSFLLGSRDPADSCSPPTIWSLPRLSLGI